MTGSTLLLALLAALPAGAITAARVAGGGWHTPLPQLAAFAAWALPAWAASVVVLVAGRHWWSALAVLNLIVLHLIWLLPRRADREARRDRAARSGPAPAWVDLRVMTINVLAGGADAAEIVRLVSTEGIDLLAVQESTPPLAQAVDAGLGEALPHTVLGREPSLTGTLIWSRWPIEAAAPSYGVTGQIVPVRLLLPGAEVVSLTAVHTLSPGRGRIRGWRRDLRALAAAASAVEGAQVLLGDFNATRDHGPFRRLLRTGLADGADAAGLAPWRALTWPADRRPIPVAVRLDHVLVTPSHVRVRDLRAVPVPATDHRAVIAHLLVAAAER